MRLCAPTMPNVGIKEGSVLERLQEGKERLRSSDTEIIWY